MDKVRMALVGCGTISWLHGPGYLKHPACEIAVLCDPVRERAELRAREWGISPRIYTSYQDVLDDGGIDAVELLTPTDLHAAQVLAALDAGKHVSCQKPLCNTIAEADSVIRAADRANVMFRLVENFIYYPPLVKAMELLRSDVIGEPSMFRTVSLLGSETVGGELKLEPEAMAWRSEPGRNLGGLLYDSAWHNYAAAMWLIGDVEKVSGVITRSEDFYLEAPSAITWKFADRDCLGLFEMIHAPQMPIKGNYYPLDDFFEIHGSKGVIWVTRCTGEMLDMPPVLVHSGTDTTAYDVPADWTESFVGASADFVDSIIRGEQARLDARASKKVLQATLAAYRAAETESAVDPRSMTA